MVEKAWLFTYSNEQLDGMPLLHRHFSSIGSEPRIMDNMKLSLVLLSILVAPAPLTAAPVLFRNEIAHSLISLASTVLFDQQLIEYQ